MPAGNTPNYALPRLDEQQSSAEVVHNDALNMLDQLSQCVVQSRTVTAEPGSPTNGQAWIIAAGATGTHWAGQDGKLAIYVDGWYFTTVRTGFMCFNVATTAWEGWNGAAWKTFTVV